MGEQMQERKQVKRGNLEISRSEDLGEGWEVWMLQRAPLFLTAEVKQILSLGRRGKKHTFMFFVLHVFVSLGLTSWPWPAFSAFFCLLPHPQTINTLHPPAPPPAPAAASCDMQMTLAYH